MSVIRHFTATGFVIHDDHLLLHWHPKVKAWLPPGGHIETNEDPVQTVIREIMEEAGVQAKVVPTGTQVTLDYPTQITPPYTIMVEDIHEPIDGYHQHIDMIYFCRLIGRPHPINDGWQWISKADLHVGKSLNRIGNSPEPPPMDVLILARHAFEIMKRAL